MAARQWAQKPGFIKGTKRIYYMPLTYIKIFKDKGCPLRKYCNYFAS